MVELKRSTGTSEGAAAIMKVSLLRNHFCHTNRSLSLGFKAACVIEESHSKRSRPRVHQLLYACIGSTILC